MDISILNEGKVLELGELLTGLRRGKVAGYFKGSEGDARGDKSQIGD
jgi:hypothetical protein